MKTNHNKSLRIFVVYNVINVMNSGCFHLMDVDGCGDYIASTTIHHFRHFIAVQERHIGEMLLHIKRFAS